MEKNLSNGEQAAGDGRTLSIRETKFAKGLGVHAPADVRYDLAGGTCSTFTATVGVDDEVGGNGSVVFQVWADGAKLYDSGVVLGSTTAKAVSVDVSGRKELRLVLTDSGDNNWSDHADWANAQLSCASRTGAYVSDLTPTAAVNGWGPVEKNMSNGEQAAGDGRALSIRGTTFAKGLGTHAPSDVKYPLNGTCTAFTATVGIDDEAAPSGSVVFQVWADGAKLYDSGAVTGSAAAKPLAVDVSGKNELRLVVTDAGDNNWSDHADWANAQLACSSTSTTSPAQPTPTPTQPTVTSGKALILHDLNHSYATPSFVAANKAYLETLPVDGLVIYPNSATKVLNPSPISVSTFASELAPVSTLSWTNLKQNFALMYSPGAFLAGGTLDAYDDAKWAIAAQNLANFGQAVRAAGLKGIMFDNENYSGYATWGPSSPACDSNAHTLVDCQTRMRQRGIQLMNALQSTFPDVVIFFTTDVSVSDATSQSNWQSAPAQCTVNDLQRANGLLGPLVVGFAQAKGPQASVVQGGEWTFCAHATSDFDYFLNWQQNLGAETGACDSLSRATGCNGFIPVADRPYWRGKTSSGAAVYGYNNMDANGNPNGGTTGTASTVTNALNRVDRYVWLYMDVGSQAKGSMLERPGSTATAVTQAFIDAIRAGKAAAGL